MEISKFGTFYNINKNSLTVGKKEIKFLNVLTKTIEHLFLDRYVYVTPSLSKLLGKLENENLYTKENFGSLEELVNYVLKHTHDYSQTKLVRMMAVIDLEDIKELDEEFVEKLMSILILSKLQYPIRFFFYTDNLAKFQNEYWFETILTMCEDVALSSLEKEDEEILLERNIVTRDIINKINEQENKLVFLGSD